MWGLYFYVVIGLKGVFDYDDLGKFEGCVFFAGEYICKEYLDIVGGAMFIGWCVVC